jgi:Icc-related predicted phosphoesterase
MSSTSVASERQPGSVPSVTDTGSVRAGREAEVESADQQPTAQERQVRIAAVGDIHFDGTARGVLTPLFADACRAADILVLCGDLTTHGEPGQIQGLVREMEGVNIPIVAVLGNHDYEAGEEAEVTAILRESGVHVLDGTNVVIEGIGFAGIKGFGGGFGRRMLGPFGEKIYKDFVQAAIDEALKLEHALRTLDAETRVAVLHYAPIPETLEGEPEAIFPFLGSSRLLPPLETYRASVVFHGHAHTGCMEGHTPAGIPVFNVAHSLLEKQTGQGFLVWSAPAPDRRQRGG